MFEEQSTNIGLRPIEHSYSVGWRHRASLVGGILFSAACTLHVSFVFCFFIVSMRNGFVRTDSHREGILPAHVVGV